MQLGKQDQNKQIRQNKADRPIILWANLRDWSLITGRGATKREGGGGSEVLPLKNPGEVGGGRNKF